jgi:hypothetical protein
MTWAALGRIGPGVRKFAVVSIGTTACFVGAIVWIAGTSGGPSGEALEAKLVELRAAGYPVTMAEARGEPADKDDNAVAALLAAAERIGDADRLDRWMFESVDPRHRTPARKARRSEVAATLAAHREFVDEARAAAALPRWSRYDDELRTPTFNWGRTSYWDLYAIRNVLGTFAAAAPSAADRQAAIEVLLTMGARLEVESWSDCMLAVQASEAGIASLGAEVARGGLRIEEAVRRFDELLCVPRLGDWRSVARSEMAEDVERFASCFGPGQPPRGGGTLLQRAERFLQAPFTSRPAKSQVEWSAADVALHLEARRAMSEIPLQTWTAFLRETEPMVRSVVRARLADDGDRLQSSAWYLVVLEADRRLARVALAAMAHRQRTGAWPESVSELAAGFPPGIPVSPMDGQLARLVFRDREVTVSFVVPAGLPPWTHFNDLTWTAPR